MFSNCREHAHVLSLGRKLAGIILFALCYVAMAAALGSNQALQVDVSSVDGNYMIANPGSDSPILRAGVEVQLDGHWLQSSNYPKHTIIKSTTVDDLGAANQWTVTFFGLTGEPDLIYHLRTYPDKPFGDIQVIVHNGTSKPIHVGSIRAIAASGNSILDLDGPALEDRVLSDSLSEDRPNIKIHDLLDTENQMHRGVGSQLIYNRQSHRSFFVGALTSDRFLTVLRIHLAGSTDKPHIASYEVDSTGTTELTKENSLRQSPPEDQIQLNLEVAPGGELPSERLLFSVNTDYHLQLEMYGSLIRQLHHARVTAPTPMGWLSWIPYFFGLNEGAALTEAQWLSQHLKRLGYDFFVIDESYQYARGEYSTPDAALYPHGFANLERKVHGMGLVPGIWTAPFEVSERSWVYENHRDWLVHNAKGEPIPAGWVDDHKDQLFVLDTTNPGSQDYLRQTYSTLVNDWGIRYIKMDFMEDSGIEGYFYRPNTTAMEAQRIGLGIIRQTVGKDVLLDKDGSEMLNPVGYVDFGRTSSDTTNTFRGTKEAASGIAARYYMNRNFYVADPDTFGVATQIMSNESLAGSNRPPLALNEAEASIALAAVSGGMYEIGNNLPTLGVEPERLALVQNKDLIAMAQLGRASIPVDLMNYLPEDKQPSIFLLKEDSRQTILTIFNWTDTARSHTVALSSLGIPGHNKCTVSGILSNVKIIHPSSDSLVVDQPAHSVRVLKIVNMSIPAQPPTVQAQHPSEVKTGETVEFTARISGQETAVTSYQWDFGDGITVKGAEVSHAYTRPGKYHVRLTAIGLDGLTGEDRFLLPVTGYMSTEFVPAEKQRYHSIQ